MSNINGYLRETISVVSPKFSVAPGIPEKKINNAVKAFGYAGNPDNVVALHDNTLLGSGKDGLLLTGQQLIHRASFSDPVSVFYSDIEVVRYVEKEVEGKKEKFENFVEIVKRDGSKLIINDLMECKYEKLAEILQKVVADFDDYKEEKQLISVDEMSEPLKVAYVKCIINMACHGGQPVDSKKFAEILLLMTRLDLSSDSRFALRAYMASAEELIPTDRLIAKIDSECPAGQIKTVHLSLAKDLISTYFGNEVLSIDGFEFFNQNRHLLKISDEDVELALMAIRSDLSILKDDCTDDQIISTLKELSAKAVAVGTPLAAVYLSGSVIGLSAAGITSGLAALGMGGMLGLSGMTAGIGVAVLIGVGAYTGVKRMTGANEITRSRRRELMLNEVIKQTQATISLLIEDVNYITDKLNELIIKQGIQDAKIRKLVELMGKMTAAGAVLTTKSDSAQSSATRLRCAQYLDEGKLKSLTREPTKASFYDFIRGFYEKRIFVEEKDGQKIEITRLVVRKDWSGRELENLAKAFEAIGYFDVAEVLKGAAADVAGKAKDKLAGLFS